ncbi:MAG: asparagine synthase [Frankia sp.]|nr:asparagine synthase [Frankia sp.]
MLTLRVDEADLRRRWRRAGDRYQSGASYVAPYNHPMIESFLVDGGGGWIAIVVRERQAATNDRAASSDHDRLLAETRDWPNDWLIVGVEEGGVTINVGAHCVAPVYLTATAGALHGSWNIADLVGWFRADDLVDLAVARRLTLRSRYSAGTVWTGVRRTTERATLTWRPATGLSVTYPHPATHSLAREFAPSISEDDVLDAYEALVEDVLDRRPYGPETAAVQLSAGLDSSNVAMSLARRHPGELLTTAMLLGGAAGEQQRARRDELRAGRFRGDLTVSALDLPPLHPSGARARGRFVSPYEEHYYEATMAMHMGLAAQGITTVFTGVGGDEMVALTAEEVTQRAVGVGKPFMPWIGKAARFALEDAEADIAPATVVNEMTLLAFACGNPLFLKAGLWPVHPFADPNLIRFGEWLPRDLRRRKHVHRQRLRRLGFSPNVTDPVLRENFADVMATGLVRYALPYLGRLLDGSPLIDTGLVDADGLREVAERIGRGHIAERDREVWQVIALDVAIRAAGR